MEKVFQAVYKDGVLRPHKPLPLEEMQRVSVTIDDSPAADGDVAGYFAPKDEPTICMKTRSRMDKLSCGQARLLSSKAPRRAQGCAPRLAVLHA